MEIRMSANKRKYAGMKAAMPDRYALDNGGKVVTAEHILNIPKEERDRSWTCLEETCAQKLHYRNGFENKKGQFVRAHFVHTRAGCSGSGETNEHKAAKYAVRDNIDKITFYLDCRHCHGTTQGWKTSETSVAEVEKQETHYNKYRIDVRVNEADGTPHAFIEVLQTHAVDPEKRCALLQVPNAKLFEILAEDVLKCLNDNLREWKLFDRSFECQPCLDDLQKQKEIHDAELKAEEEETKRSEEAQKIWAAAFQAKCEQARKEQESLQKEANEKQARRDEYYLCNLLIQETRRKMDHEEEEEENEEEEEEGRKTYSRSLLRRQRAEDAKLSNDEIIRQEREDLSKRAEAQSKADELLRKWDADAPERARRAAEYYQQQQQAEKLKPNHEPKQHHGIIKSQYPQHRRNIWMSFMKNAK